MEEFQRGDVVFARFIFTDVSQTKNRPAVIIAALPNDDFILCPVTSRRRQNDPFQIELKKDEILGRKLPQDSFMTQPVDDRASKLDSLEARHFAPREAQTGHRSDSAHRNGFQIATEPLSK